MNWFDIIKVEDIDFDSAIQSFGHYSMESREITFEETLEMMGAKMFGEKPPDKKEGDFLRESIRINHQEIYRHLKERLGKEPTDKQIAMYVVRIIMHEGTHAGMGQEQLAMTDPQSEYGAFIGQFPESMYMRMKSFLKHPATERHMFHPAIYEAYGFSAFTPRFAEVIKETIIVADALGKTDEDKEKIVQLEALARKAGDKDLAEQDLTDIKGLIDRWGIKNRSFIEKLLKDNNLSPNYNNEETEKMVGAVTSTTAGMESKPRFSHKKKEDDE